MGTNYLAPTWRQPKNANKDKLSNYSITYDGGNDYITIDDNIFSGLETWSMAGFYNLSTLNVDNAIFGKYGNSPQQILLYWDNPLGWRLLWNGVSASGQLVQLPTIQANEWHFIAITYDGTTVKMYLDDQVYTGSATTGAIISDTLPWQIGADGNSNKDFNGKLSQLSFYDYAVEATEISYLRNGGNPLVINGAEPIAYYPLGDNSNPTALAGYPNIISAADSVFEFDGSTDYIDTPEVDLQTTNTISLWYNRSASGTGVLVGQGTAWYDYTIRLAPDGGIKYADKNSSPVIDFQSAATKALASPLNKWINIIIVRTGTTANCWVNGINNDGAQTFGAGTQEGTVFNRFGMSGDGTSFGFNGKLSNIAAWNDDQSANVINIYNNGLPLLELSEIPGKDNLMVWYKLNQSAVLTPGVPTNWTITKIGSPNYSGSNDGCYAGTAGTSPYNSGLVWHDNNSGATVGSDYFQWNSPTIFTSGNNIVLSSSGGSYNGQFGGGSQAILEYNIDNGSWVNWHTQTNPTTGSNPTFTIPSTGNLTVSNNIKIRIKGVDFGSAGSYLKINDISATGGTSNYNESFTNSTRYGFSGGSENQPPATSSADHWDIPDNRSAYPRSFNFKAADSSFFNSGDILHNDGQTPMSVTGWVKITTAAASSNAMPIASKKKIRSAPTYSMDGWEVTFLTSGVQTNRLYFNYTTDGISATGGLRKKALTKSFTDGLWHHVAVTYDGSGNTDGIKFYVDGDEDTSTQTLTNNLSGSMPNNPSVDFLIGKTPKYGGSNYMDGDMSNVQVWDSKLESADVLSLYNNGVPLPTASVEPSNLKAWYKLDNTELFDGTNWSMQNQKYPSNWKSALSFDGSAYIDISSTTSPYEPKIDGSQNFSMSFWIRSTFQPSGYYTTRFFSRLVGTGVGADIIRVKQGAPPFLGGGTNYVINSNTNVYGTTTLNDGIWHNVVLTYDSSTGDLLYYVDGTPEKKYNSNDDVTGNYASGGDIRINICGGPSTQRWIGQASNYTLFEGSKLTPSEISTLYNNGSPESNPSFSPTSWWKLDNTTTGIQDSVGSKNGTNNGATKVNTFISPEAATSSGMTEANLIDDNVSTVNAESDTLPASALVQSDLTRKQPFSNYSINFNGTEDYFSIPSSGALDTFHQNPFSISLWFKTSTGGTMILTEKATSSSATSRAFYIYLSGGVVIWYGATASPSYTNGSYNDGNWHHIACVAESDTVARIYVDGVDDTNNIAKDRIGTSSVTAPIILGTTYNQSGFFFNGEMSNAAIWTYALTTEEILDVYNNGIPSNLNTSFTPGQPDYWWPIDEDYTYFNGSVLVARDAISGNDGTGVNLIQENIVGNAPGSNANGIGSNLTIASLKGDMKNSTNNSYSINMADYADTADSGRSTNVP